MYLSSVHLKIALFLLIVLLDSLAHTADSLEQISGDKWHVILYQRLWPGKLWHYSYHNFLITVHLKYTTKLLRNGIKLIKIGYCYSMG